LPGQKASVFRKFEEENEAFMSARAYLDWNATAPLRVEARAAMLAAMDMVGNPSSVHSEGRAARHLIEKARADVAALVGAEPRNVVFTSGGTEANGLALSPGLGQGNGGAKRSVLLVSAVEHPSVHSGGRFLQDSVRELPVNAQGVVDFAALSATLSELADRKIGFVAAVMLANNETGVIQPIADIAEIVHQAGGLLHVDAVQAAGKIPIHIKALGADTLSISAHKIGGPKGVGALIKAEESLHIEPVTTGGGQERGARAGTENVIGIAGFGAAAAAVARDLAEVSQSIMILRDSLEYELRRIRPDTVFFGLPESGANTPKRLPNTTLFAVPGAAADTSLIALDLAGVAVSAGSACSSGKVAASHVLAAMGVPLELAACALRVSLGPDTTQAEIDLFLKAWIKRVAGLSKGRNELAA
jgi:cysteine desulfurase